MYTFRPAVRENTPLIIGLAGGTKSGKTMSALRLATGMANGGLIAMLNAEGPRGHQYAEKFRYQACELEAPYRPTHYTEALQAAAALKPSVVIIDSGSHMWDGPGGVLEWHEEILDRIAGDDQKRRERSTFAAWVEPKAAENAFIYQMLAMSCAVILCLRAKEKIRIVPGKPPIDLGWQPIVGERVAFETLFTLMLPPHSGGVPDLSISDMREPFGEMIPKDNPLDETLGLRLAEWAKGAKPVQPVVTSPSAGYGNGSDPVRTTAPSDEWVSAFAAVESTKAGGELWKVVSATDVRGAFTESEWVAIVRAKDAAKARLSEPAPADPAQMAIVE